MLAAALQGNYHQAILGDLNTMVSILCPAGYMEVTGTHVSDCSVVPNHVGVTIS